jgi:hypothetical protein
VRIAIFGARSSRGAESARRFAVLDVRGDVQALDIEELKALLERGCCAARDVRRASGR